MMDWHKLLSHKRLRGALDDADDARSPDLRDIDRIVFSSAFRRLQDKTQVFPLPHSDYVRTRLTHSIESSCVGRSMGAIVGKTIIERHKLHGTLAPINFGVTVAAACLAHDIGNPPFGHSGEDAMRHWVQTSRTARALLDQMDDREEADFVNFEGNAQGFRILTRLQNADVEGGLQLTSSTLAAFTKYPRESLAPNDGALPEGASTKKHGFFQREAEFFEEVAEEVGLIRRSNKPRCWVRHPLAFLVEAADDICYHIIDYEDGFRLGQVSYNEIEHNFLDIVSDTETRERLIRIRENQDKVAYLRARVINVLARRVAEVFLDEEGNILEGRFDQPLVSRIPASNVLATIKTRSLESVYAAQSVLEIEAAGFEVVGGLLEHLVAAARDVGDNNDRAAPISKKHLQLLPCRYSKVENDPYKRLLRITDYIAGMTDSFAVSLYRKIKGISLPGR